MEKTPVVSIVMPAYNAARFVREAVNSVLAQTFVDLELIVVDDGSSDDTAEIVKGVAEHDDRVVLVRQRSSGRPSIARNTGIGIARGRYLAFLDSDDYLLPGKVEAMVSGLVDHPQWVAVFHDLRLVDVDGGELGVSYLQDANFRELSQGWITDAGSGWWDCGPRFFVFMSLMFAAVHTQSVMIDRSRLDASDVLFDPGFVICEDTDLWVRLALGGRLGYLDRVLSCYRQHGNSITRNEVLLATQMLLFHQRNYARLLPLLNQGERRRYQKKLADCYENAGYAHYNKFALSEARQAYADAFKVSQEPRHLLNYVKACLPEAVLRKLRRRAGGNSLS